MYTGDRLSFTNRTIVGKPVSSPRALCKYSKDNHRAGSKKMHEAAAFALFSLSFQKLSYANLYLPVTFRHSTLLHISASTVVSSTTSMLIRPNPTSLLFRKLSEMANSNNLSRAGPDFVHLDNDEPLSL